MKKFIALLLSALLFLSPALCAADTTLPGGLLCLEEGSGYAVTVDPEDGTLEITDPDGNLFAAEVHSCEELGMGEELLRMSLYGLIGQTREDITYGDRTREANGFMYITMNDHGFINGFMAVGGGTMLIVYAMGGEDIAAYERLLGALHPTNTEKAEEPSDPSDAYVSGAEDIAGVYEFEAEGVKIPAVSLILTRGGRGRLSNSSGSFTFDFEIRDGQIVPYTDDEIAFICGEDGSITFQFEGNRLRFVKRDPVAGSPGITGKWKASKMIVNGSTLDSTMMGILGWTIELTAYDDGTVDWHAVTDSENWAAQSWGIDEDGLYMFNGQRNPCTLEDGVLCFSTNGGNIFFAYAGPIE